MELTPIDFIAQLINAQTTREEGYSTPVRWGSLRDDLKSKYKAEAEQIFQKWKNEEIIAELCRKKLMSSRATMHCGSCKATRPCGSSSHHQTLAPPINP